MTGNRLSAHVESGTSFSIPRHPGNTYAEDLAIHYNSRRNRADVEWYVDSSGNVRIGDAPQFTAEQTRMIHERTERERRQWKRGQTHAMPEYD